MNPWSDVVSAYEVELDALESARAAYVSAAHQILESLRRDWDLRLRPHLMPRWAMEVRLDPYPDRKPVADTVRAVLRGPGGLNVNLEAWLARPWGGPAATLRLAIGLDDQPDELFGDERRAQVALAAEALPEGLPGRRFDLATHAEADPAGHLHLCTLSLADRSLAQIIAEAGEAGAALFGGAMAVMERMEAHTQPIRNAVGGLLAARDRLTGEAASARWSLRPDARVGAWRGGTYLQLQRGPEALWLVTRPKEQRMLAGGPNAETIEAFAASLGHETFSFDGSRNFECFDGGALRAGVDDAVYDLFKAFVAFVS